jgi:quinol monooxygenase YgiN
MVHASLRIKFASEKLAEASEILCSLVERTRVSPGCFGCDVYQDLLEPWVLLFEEWWNTQAELDRHLRSVLYQHVLLVMEMALEFPTIRFSEISTTTGIETIKKSRCGPSF